MSNLDAPPSYVTSGQFSAPDFETASVRSAAPSYTSAAPAYHSALSPAHQTPSASSTSPSSPSPIGLPRAAVSPNTAWSTVRANPTARHYRAVAARRRAREEEARRSVAMRKTLCVEEAVGFLHRSFEGEALAGEDAAAQSESEQTALCGNKVLTQENERWDWMLDQMKDWDDRQNDWAKFRREKETPRPGGWLASLLGRK